MIDTEWPIDDSPIRRSRKCNSSLPDEPVLMKLYTVTVFILRMRMKEDNLGLKYFKEDNK